MTHDPWLFIGLISASLTVPLVYAAKTLLSLKHTVFVPLIRTRDRQGKAHPFVRLIAGSVSHPITRRSVWLPSVMS